MSSQSAADLEYVTVVPCSVVFVLRTVYRGKILHARNQHLWNHRGLSVAFSTQMSQFRCISKGLSLPQWMFKDKSNGFSLASSNGVSLLWFLVSYFALSLYIYLSPPLSLYIHIYIYIYIYIHMYTIDASHDETGCTRHCGCPLQRWNQQTLKSNNTWKTRWLAKHCGLLVQHWHINNTLKHTAYERQESLQTIVELCVTVEIYSRNMLQAMLCVMHLCYFNGL